MNGINIEKILFLDIETVPQFRKFELLPAAFAALWEKKAGQLKNDESLPPSDLYERAGIYSEFGKIICISVCFFKSGVLRVKSFYGHDEAVILEEFKTLLLKHFSAPGFNLCAHNGKEFDFPYIARRMLINAIPIPEILDTRLKKPWEVTLLDTMEMWKFGDYKNYTSLELLAAVFGIPTPKDDIAGHDIARVYWEENDLSRIAVYCCKDAVTVARLYMKFFGHGELHDEHIVMV